MSDQAARAARNQTSSCCGNAKGAARRIEERPFDLPWLAVSGAPMELFDPERHVPRQSAGHAGPSGADAPLPLAVAARACGRVQLIPREEDCRALWDRYGMLDNIRAHSRKVADLAYAMALLAKERGVPVAPEAVLAAGLLHDIGKTYTIFHGGSHAQLGAAWTMLQTRNGPIAQSVLFHVYWPFAERFDDDSLFLVHAIIYADKRCKHDAYVSLDNRFDDLLDRYGVNDYIKSRIVLSLEQGKRIEAALSRRLGVKLDEHTADRGRLVKRT